MPRFVHLHRNDHRDQRRRIDHHITLRRPSSARVTAAAIELPAHAVADGVPVAMGRRQWHDPWLMRMRLLLAAAVAVVGFTALAQASAAGGGAEGVPRFGHVFVIIGENTDYQHVTTTNAPYLTTTMRPSSAWLDNYYAATHWSQANYVALTTGQFTSCEQHDGGTACHQNVDNLYHQLDQHGIELEGVAGGRRRRAATGVGVELHQRRALPADRLLHNGQSADPVRRHRGAGWCLVGDHALQRMPRRRRVGGDRQRPDGHVQRRSEPGIGRRPSTSIIPNGCDDGEGNCDPVNDRIRSTTTSCPGRSR